MENAIKFYRGDENDVVVETEKLNESIFLEQYTKALMLVNNIAQKPSCQIPSVVTFCGDRGEGKTSCMKTILNMLVNHEQRYVKDFLSSVILKKGQNGQPDDTLSNHCTDILKTDYKPLKVIDPAFFDEEHNVLQLLLGQMFNEFKQEYENKDIDQEKKNSLIGLAEHFQRAKECLTQIKQPREKIYDPLEELTALSAAEELQKSINELIESYLDYFVPKKEDANPSMLIVCIDDIDLNIDGAYEMVEQIRKYLVSKRCLLLISLNVDQLIDVVANYLNKKTAVGYKMDTDQMAAKYVTKLIPTDNRIIMPKTYEMCDTPMEIYATHQDVEPIKFNSVKEAVVQLIYNKTRYLFYNSNGGVSPIVPNNLRSLRHLLGLLLGMNNFVSNEESISNKHAFKAYFYQTWVHQLKEEDQQAVALLVRGEDATTVNKYAVSLLAKRIKEDVDKATLLSDIINPINYNYNVSVGDVFYVLNYLERSNVDEDLRLLLFFIKSFYSMKLYEYYDIISDSMAYLYPESKDDGEIFRRDAWFKRTNLMQRFVNGSYFTYEPDELLPPTDNGRSKRDMKVINAGVLRTLASSKLLEDMSRFEQMNDEEKAKFKMRFRITEFFALTAKKSISSRKKETFDRLHREYNEPYHLSDYNLGTGYLVFDVMAPFYNILNLKYTYGRLSYLRKENEAIDFYTFAYKQEWSLLRRMIDFVRVKEHNEFKNEQDPLWEIDRNLPVLDTPKQLEEALFRLMSNAVIRNGEVLTAVMEAIQNRRANMHNRRDNKMVLKEFYRDIINTEMRTYKNHETDKPYIMRFAFLEALIELLDEDGNNALTQIYETGKDTQDTTDEDVQNQFGAFFSQNFKTKKRSAIISDMNKLYIDVRMRVKDALWFKMFPDEKKSYAREDILSVFKENFMEMTGLIKASEFYIDDLEQ